MTREELLIEIQNVDTQGSYVKNEITGRAMKDIMQLIDTYTKGKVLEARIDERKRTIGEWNAAGAKYGEAYNKRLYAIAKNGEKRIAELEQLLQKGEK